MRINDGEPVIIIIVLISVFYCLQITNIGPTTWVGLQALLQLEQTDYITYTDIEVIIIICFMCTILFTSSIIYLRPDA